MIIEVMFPHSSLSLRILTLGLRLSIHRLSKFNSGPMPLRHGALPPFYMPPFPSFCNKSLPSLLLLPSPRLRLCRRPSPPPPPLLLLLLRTLFSFPTFFPSCILLLHPPPLSFFVLFLSSFPATRIDVPRLIPGFPMTATHYHSPTISHS